MSFIRNNSKHTPRDANRKALEVRDVVYIIGDPDGRAVIVELKPFEDDPSRFWARLILVSCPEPKEGTPELWEETTELEKMPLDP